MRRFGIVIHNSKLTVFERNLKAEKLSIEIEPATIPNATFITVETDYHGRLAEIIKTSNEECAGNHRERNRRGDEF